MYNRFENYSLKKLSLITPYLNPEDLDKVLNNLSKDEKFELIRLISITDYNNEDNLEKIKRILINEIRNTNSIYLLREDLDTLSLEEILKIYGGVRPIKFDDIFLMDDKTIQMIISSEYMNDSIISFSLINVNDEKVNKILKNVSKRRRDYIKEEIELLANVKEDSINEYREQFVNIVFKLINTGEIIAFY